MKKTLADIGGKLGASPGVAVKADDFLTRANETIANFKSLIELAARLKGQGSGNIEAKIASNEAPPAQSFEAKNLKGGGNLDRIAQQLLAAGLGDIPISQLLQQLSPFTIKQLMEKAKNARPKK